MTRTVSTVLAVFAGLLLAGVIPATLPVTATVFALALTGALFGGDPRRIVDFAVTAVTDVAEVVTTTAASVVDADTTEE